MNGRRAKAIRRQVYGDQSTRQRKWAVDTFALAKGWGRTVRDTGLRHAYQQAKKAWKRGQAAEERQAGAAA